MAHGSLDHIHESRRRWWCVVSLGVLTLICGSIGTWKYEHEHFQGVTHGVSPIYHAAQMLILHTVHFDKGVNGWIEAGRWFGAATFFLTAGTLLHQRLRREFNLFRLAGWTNHYVICGLGQKGFAIAHCLREKNHNARVVVLDPAPDAALAEQCEARGICLLVADATGPKALKQARVAHAEEVIVITPIDETNVRIANEVRRVCGGQPTKPTACHVHVSDIDLREALQQWDEAQGRSSCPLHFFDVFDAEARRTLLELPIDGTGIRKDDARSVHLVLIGFGRLGRSLALRAAKMGHFANNKPLSISVIDRDAVQQRERFLFRHPILEGAKVCRIDFHTAEAESLSARKLIEQWSSEPDRILHVFVCLDNDARAVEVALRLRNVLRSRPDRNLLVRIRSRASLASILEASPASGVRVTPFGMIEDACSEDAFRTDHRDALARAIHEAFVFERTAGSRRNQTNDPALREWENLREEIRESNRQQADHIAIKLRAVGCKLVDSSQPGEAVVEFDWKEIALLAPIEHQRWNAERWLAGWRYGTPSDKDQRINENLVSWDELPDSIRKYDEESVAKIPELLKHAKPALKVVRVSET